MKRLLILIIVCCFALQAADAKTVGKGENRPTVQSALGGSYYVRSIPHEYFGTKGTTQIFKVKIGGDEVLDEYPIYMRGEIYLGWSPIKGKWCLVHAESERTSSEEAYDKVGKLAHLTFYMGGKEILSYAGEDLKKMGLERSVATLEHKIPGQFMIHGINQISGTNHYVLSIEKIGKDPAVTEEILMDITTGKTFSGIPVKHSRMG